MEMRPNGHWVFPTLEWTEREPGEAQGREGGGSWLSLGTQCLPLVRSWKNTRKDKVLLAHLWATWTWFWVSASFFPLKEIEKSYRNIQISYIKMERKLSVPAGRFECWDDLPSHIFIRPSTTKWVYNKIETQGEIALDCTPHVGVD